MYNILCVCVCVCVCTCSVVSDFVTPWIVACQVPPCMEFSRQEYWRGLPFSPLEDLPDPEIKSASPVSCILHWQADSLPLSHQGSPYNRLGYLKKKKITVMSITGKDLHYQLRRKSLITELELEEIFMLRNQMKNLANWGKYSVPAVGIQG